MELDNKSEVPIERLAKYFESPAFTSLNIEEIELHSDSPITAAKLLRDRLPSLKFNVNTLSPVETILRIVKAKFFLGTNSKLSLWGAILGLKIIDKSRIILPVEFKNQIYLNVDAFKSYNKLYFYD